MQLHLGPSYGEPCHELPDRVFWMVHGGGKDQTFWGSQCGAYGGSCDIGAESALNELSVFSCHSTRTLLRKKLPDILISSQRTTTIFWPDKICFEIMEANRPRR